MISAAPAKKSAACQDLADAEAPEHPGHERGINEAPDGKPADGEAGLRRSAPAAFLEQRRHVREDAEDRDALDEDEAEQGQGAGVRQDVAIAPEGAREVEPAAGKRPAEADDGGGKRQGDHGGGQGEDAAPADQLRQQSSKGGAGKLSDDDRHEIAAERHLAPGHVDPIADQGDRERDRPSGGGTGDDAKGEQRRRIGREDRAGERQEQDQERHLHDALLAERIADGTQHRLDESIGQREGSREQRDCLRRRAQVPGDDPDHGLDRAAGKGARKAAGGEDEDQIAGGHGILTIGAATGALLPIMTVPFRNGCERKPTVFPGHGGDTLARHHRPRAGDLDK